jgi:phage FluMu protein Com
MKRCPNCNEYLSDEAIQCKTCLEYLDGKVRVDERCECGNLVAKLTENTVEIKCRRCKRIRIIPMDQLAERYRILLERAPREKIASAAETADRS